MTERRPRYDCGLVIPGTPYQVMRFIGSGAMGAVYEVQHRELRKAFVLKILHDDLADLEDSVQRIKCEGRFLARIEHPNIVKVTDAGLTTHGVPFFVMERLEGETLASHMRRYARWPLCDVIWLAIGVLDALAAAHSLGIIHRDIKPSNILLTRDSGVKLLDFGIAKSSAMDAAATAKGITLGTPRYMAPEQAMGGHADGRSDLYSLGVIMYELLAGEHPFVHALTPVEMLIAQAGWQVPPLPSYSVTAPGIAAIVTGLLSKDPDARPNSATAVKAAVLAFEQVALPLRSLTPSEDVNASATATASCRFVYRRTSQGAKRQSLLRLGGTGGRKWWGLFGASLAVVLVGAVRMGSLESSKSASAFRVERHAQFLNPLTPMSVPLRPWIGVSVPTAPRTETGVPTPRVAPGSASATAVTTIRRKTVRKARSPTTNARAEPAERPAELEDLTRR